MARAAWPRAFAAVLGTWVAVVPGLGCDLSPDFPNGVFACATDDDCPASQACVGVGGAARCFTRGVDAGPVPCVPDGLVDLPDGDHVDSDCDGIDGTLSASVFVSPSGDDLASGTREAPVRSVQRGIEVAIADSARDQVLIAEGTYLEAIALVEGVHLHGGYELTWTRSDAAVTTLRADLPLTADDVSALTRVTGLRIVSNSATDPGASSVAVRIRGSSGVSLEQVVIEAGDGAAGALPAAAAARPADAQDGGTGGDGGLVHVDSPPPARGPGGVSVCSCVSGGAGGFPSLSASPRVGLPGQSLDGVGCVNGVGGGTGGTMGMPGADGVHGGAGSRALEGSFTADGYAPVAGGDGGPGTPAGGGSGGGGSTGFLCDVSNQINVFGGAGGGGGAGGCGGAGGTGGAGGGASIGLLAVASEVTLVDVRITSGAGGAGGAGQGGQDGGLGGGGGEGGTGGNFCAVTPSQNYPDGAMGGPGGTGGGGGGGAGGAGGPSVALLLLEGASQADTSSGVQLVVGSGGSGGAGGAAGTGGSGTPGAGDSGAMGSAILSHTVTPP